MGGNYPRNVLSLNEGKKSRRLLNYNKNNVNRFIYNGFPFFPSSARRALFAIITWSVDFIILLFHLTDELINLFAVFEQRIELKSCILHFIYHLRWYMISLTNRESNVEHFLRIESKFNAAIHSRTICRYCRGLTVSETWHLSFNLNNNFQSNRPSAFLRIKFQIAQILDIWYTFVVYYCLKVPLTECKTLKMSERRQLTFITWRNSKFRW